MIEVKTNKIKQLNIRKNNSYIYSLINKKGMYYDLIQHIKSNKDIISFYFCDKNNSKTLYILTENEFQDEKYNFVKNQSNDVSDIIKANLYIRALSKKENSSFFLTDRLAEYVPHKSKNKMVVTNEINISEDLNIGVSVKTYEKLLDVLKGNGVEKQKRIRKMPRYSLDGNKLKYNKDDGDFIGKRSKANSNNKNTVDVFDKALSKITKSITFHNFNRLVSESDLIDIDYESFYGEYINTRSSKTGVSPSDKDKNEKYISIVKSAFDGKRISIINLTKSIELKNKLIDFFKLKLKDIKIEFVDSEYDYQFSITEDKSYYENNKNETDPYIDFKSENPFAQNISRTQIESLKTNTNTIIVCLKELLIKENIKNKKFMHFAPKFDFDFYYHKDDKVYGISSINGEITHKQYDYFEDFESENEDFEDLIFDNNLDVLNGDMFMRINGKAIIIKETKISPMPNIDEIMKIGREIEINSEKKYPISDLKEILSLKEIKEHEQILISHIIDSGYKKFDFNLLKKENEKLKKDESIKSVKDGFSSRGYGTIFKFIMNKYNVELKLSISSEKDGGVNHLVKNAIGIWFSEKDNMYFCGDAQAVKGVARFNYFHKLYAKEKVPMEYFEFIDLFYVKHLNYSSKPMPMKYIREMHKI